jgi:hypothetical protein
MLSEKADLSKTHWAFQPVQHFEPPQVADSPELIRSPVDSFLLAKLNAVGLEMSPETDRRTLIRRVSYALTGLPPSAQEVEQFVADKIQHSYEKLIDRLLASPRMVSNGRGTGWMLLDILTRRAMSTAAKNASGFMHGITVTGS